MNLKIPLKKTKFNFAENDSSMEITPISSAFNW